MSPDEKEPFLVQSASPDWVAPFQVCVGVGAIGTTSCYAHGQIFFMGEGVLR